MVTTTGLGDIRADPWLRAAMDVFADAIGGLGPVLDVGCGPGTVTGYLALRARNQKLEAELATTKTALEIMGKGVP